MLEAVRPVMFVVLWKLGAVRINPGDRRTSVEDERNGFVVAADCDCFLFSADPG